MFNAGRGRKKGKFGWDAHPTLPNLGSLEMKKRRGEKLGPKKNTKREKLGELWSVLEGQHLMLERTAGLENCTGGKTRMDGRKTRS